MNPQSKLEVNSSSWPKARENVWHRAKIGFDFTSDWMKKWREFFKPIGLFRVAFCLCIKTSLRNHSNGNVFHLQVYFHASQTHFKVLHEDLC